MIVVLAGHVDHGKTALVEALTGINTDSLEEERRRGLTIDLGFAYANLRDERVGFVDVPGHHRFIQNMIAGVATYQYALLAVAADDGVMPQTREHLQILTLLGLTVGAVAVTKTDLVDETHLEILKSDLVEFLRGSFLEDAPVIETSVVAGAGIANLKNTIQEQAAKVQIENDSACFRMAIDRCFSLQGQGTIVTGTVGNGTVHVGDTIRLSGTGDGIRVRSLRVNDEVSEQALAGDRCGMNLASVDTRDAGRGSWLCSENGYLDVSRVLARLSVVSDFPREVKHWNSVHVYHATSHCEANIGLLGGKRVSRDEERVVEIACATSMHFKVGDRVIVRDRHLQRTVGGAQILAIPQQIQRVRTENRIWADAITSVSELNASKVLAEISKHTVVDLEHYRRSWNLSPESFASITGELDLVQSEYYAFAKLSFDETASQIRRVLRAHHKSHPDLPGLNKQSLNKQVALDKTSLNFVLNQLVRSNSLKMNQGQFALADFRQAQIQYNQKLYAQLEPFIRDSQPMSLGDLSKELRLPLNRLEQETRKMAHAGVLIKFSKRRIIHKTKFEKCVELATELSNTNAFTISNFRDRSRLGRNTVVQLLEYFDQIGFTRRIDDQRKVIDPSAVI